MPACLIALWQRQLWKNKVETLVLWPAACLCQCNHTSAICFSQNPGTNSSQDAELGQALWDHMPQVWWGAPGCPTAPESLQSIHPSITAKFSMSCTAGFLLKDTNFGNCHLCVCVCRQAVQPTVYHTTYPRALQEHPGTTHFTRSKHFVTSSFSSQMASLQFPEAPVIQPPRCPQAASWTLLKASMWKMQNCSHDEASHFRGTTDVIPNIPNTGFHKCICNQVNHAKKIPKHCKLSYVWVNTEKWPLLQFCPAAHLHLSTVVTTWNRDLLQSIHNGDWEKGLSQSVWSGIVYIGHTQHLYPTVDWKQSRRFCGFHSFNCSKKGCAPSFKKPADTSQSILLIPITRIENGKAV